MSRRLVILAASLAVGAAVMVAVVQLDDEDAGDTVAADRGAFAASDPAAPGALDAHPTRTIVPTPVTADGGSVARDSARSIVGRVVDHGGVGVANTKLQVALHVPGGEPNYAPVDSFSTELATGEDGRFSVTVPPHGKYRLIAEVDACSIAIKDWVNPGDDVVIELARAASLAGDLVSADTNAPIAGAKVKLFMPEVPEVSFRETTSDNAGAFRLAGLPEGEVQLLVMGAAFPDRWEVCHPRAGVETRVHLALDPGLVVRGRVVDRETARPIAGATVAAGARSASANSEGVFELRGLDKEDRVWAAADGFVTSTVTVALNRERAAPFVEIALERGRILGGTVVSEDGLPLVGARIAWAGGPVTDESGRFALRVSGPENWEISASLEGYSEGSAPVTVSPTGDLEPLRIVLKKPDATILGRVVDSQGTAVGGIRVEAVAFGFREKVVATAEDGWVRLHGLARGTEYLVSARCRNYAESFQTVVTQDAPNATTEVKMHLEELRTVTGIVVDDGGAPIAGAHVSGCGTRGEVRITGPDGSFSFRIPVSAPVAVRAAAHGHWAAGGVEAPTGDNSPLRLVLNRAGLIRGRVIDAATRAAVRMARLTVFVPETFDAGDHRTAVTYGATAETADFCFTVPGGSYLIETSADGYVPAIRRPVDVAPGQTCDIGDLVLAKGGSVEALIREHNGAPASNMLVQIMSETGRLIETASRQASTDETGYVRRDGLDAGRYWLLVRPSEWVAVEGVTVSRPVDVRRGELTRIECDLPPWCALDVIVGTVDSKSTVEQVASGLDGWVGGTQSSAVGSVETIVENLSGRPFAFQTYNVNGVATASPSATISTLASTEDRARGVFSYLPAGRYRITSRSEGFTPIERIVTLAPDKKTEVVIELQKQDTAPK